MRLPIEMSEHAVELLAEAADLLCAKREKSAEHYAKQGRRKRNGAGERATLGDLQAKATADADALRRMADELDALLPADEEEPVLEAPILCATCHRKGPSMHRACGLPGCECHCNR